MFSETTVKLMISIVLRVVVERTQLKVLYPGTAGPVLPFTFFQIRIELVCKIRVIRFLNKIAGNCEAVERELWLVFGNDSIDILF